MYSHSSNYGVRHFDQARWSKFQDLYVTAVEQSVEAAPSVYEAALLKHGSASGIAEAVLAKITKDGLYHIGLDGQGFKLVCKKLGIKHTRKAITMWLINGSVGSA